MNQAKFVCEEGKCTACGSCIQICPVHCISYYKNSHETKMAIKDPTKCTSCHLCESACPQNMIRRGSKPLRCYAAWSCAENERLTSASGGIATEIYNHFASIGGYYAGVSIDSDYTTTYKLNNYPTYMGEFKNSKYVYSDTVDVFKKIAKTLGMGKEVAFIGLPCQVAGLEQYLEVKRINCSRLFLVDIVCHGTAPDEFLKEHITSIEEKKKRKAKQVLFRDPDEGTHTFTFSLKDDKGTFYKKKVHRTDTYQVGYHNGIIYRDNCYQCRYACCERYGDLTISDFSGLGKIQPFEMSHRNVSCVLVNTEKGQEIIDLLAIEKSICAHERPLDEALKYEKQLQHPTPETDYRKKFLALYEQTHDFEFSVQQSAAPIMKRNELRYYSHVEEIRNCISAVVPRKMKTRLKRLLK